MTVLAQLLKEDIQRRQWSERQMARNLGLSATTINRFLAGEAIDLETMLKICKWLGVKPSAAVDSFIDEAPEGYITQLSVLLDADPVVKELFQRLVSRIEEGKVPTSALREAMQYVEFRYMLEENFTGGTQNTGQQDT